MYNTTGMAQRIARVRLRQLFCSVLQPSSIRGSATPWTYFQRPVDVLGVVRKADAQCNKLATVLVDSICYDRRAVASWQK